MFTIVFSAGNSSASLKFFRNRKLTQKERPTREFNSRGNSSVPRTPPPSHLAPWPPRVSAHRRGSSQFTITDFKTDCESSACQKPGSGQWITGFKAPALPSNRETLAELFSPGRLFLYQQNEVSSSRATHPTTLWTANSQKAVCGL